MRALGLRSPVLPNTLLLGLSLGLLIGIHLLVLATPLRAAPLGDHEAWQQAMLDTASATRAGDVLEASRGMRLAINEAIYFPVSDPRIEQTMGRAAGIANLTAKTSLRRTVAYLVTLRHEVEKQAGSDHVITISLLGLTGDWLRKSGDLDAALGCFEEAHQRAIRTLGEANQITLEMQSAKASALLRTGNYVEGLSEAKLAHSISHSVFGPAHPTTVKAAGPLVYGLDAADRGEEALTLSETTLSEVKKHGVPPTLALLYLMEARAMVFLNVYQHAEARNTALEAQETARRGGFEESADTYTTLAKANANLGDHEAALRAIDLALKLVEAKSGASSPALRNPLIYRSEFQHSLGRYAEAEATLLRVLESYGGMQNLAVAGRGLLARLAEPIHAQGRHDEAERLFALDLEHAEQRQPDSRSIGILQSRRVRARAKAGQWDLVEQEVDEALERVDHPSAYVGPVTLSTFVIKAELEQVRGRTKTALKAYERALEKGEQHFGEHSPWLLPILEGYAKALEARGKSKKAHGLLARAEAIRSKSQREIAPATMALQPVKLDALNLAFVPPDRDWISQDPELLGSDALFTYVNTQYRIWGDLRAFEFTRGTPADIAATLAQTTLQNFRAKGSDVRLIFEGDQDLGGFDGYEVAFTNVLNDEALEFRFWFGVRNGFVYQVANWAQAGTPSLEVQSQNFRKGLSQIDPERVARGDEAAPLPYRSKSFGFSVDLAAAGLTVASTADVNYAELIATRSDVDAGLMVIPYFLFGFSTPVDTLRRALAQANQLNPPVGLKAVDAPGFDAMEFEFEYEVDGEKFVYRTRFVHGAGRAYTIIVWQPIGTELDGLDPGIVQLVPSADEPDIERLSVLERRRHTHLFGSLFRIELGQGRGEEAATALRAASRIAPPLAQLQFELLLTWFETKRYAEIAPLTEQAQRAFPEDGRFAALHGMALLGLGRTVDALEAYSRAAELGYRDIEMLSRHASALLDLGRSDEALALFDLEQNAALTESVAGRKLRSNVLDAAGRSADAVEVSLALHEEFPEDVSLLLDLAELEARGGEPQAALKHCDAIEVKAGTSTRLTSTRALAYYHLARYDEALAALRVTIDLDPSYPGASDFLEVLRSFTGEGSNEMVRSPIEALEIPSWAPPAPTVVDERGLEYGARYARKATVIEFLPDRPGRESRHFEIDILDEKGMRRYSTLEFTFDPGAERLFINELTVRDEDGNVVSSHQPKDTYVLDENNPRIKTHRKVVHVPVRGLRVGARVSGIVTWQTKQPRNVVPFKSVLLTAADPLARSELYILGDTDRVETKTQGAVSTKRHEQGLSFWADTPPLLANESLAQHWEAHAPLVRIGDAEQTWNVLSKDYLGEIAESLEDRTGITELAQRIAEAERDPVRLAERFASFVRDEIRYEAIEFGRNAWVPRTAPKVLKTRYGDCKEKALLLHLLLESFEIDSQLVLVRSAGPVEPALPDLAQFDHMILYCASCGEDGRFIDATDRYVTRGESAPRGLGKQLGLILDEHSETLQALPAPASTRMDIDRKAVLEQDGSAQVVDTVRFQGDAAATMREVLSNLERGDWEKSFFYPVVARGKDIEFESVDVATLDATDARVELTLRYTVRNVSTRADQRLLGTLPTVWADLFLSLDRVPNRSTPVELKNPIEFNLALEVATPDAYAFVGTNEAGKQEDPLRFFKLSEKRDQASKFSVYKTQIRRTGGVHPAEAYSTLQRESTEILDRLSQPFALEHR